MKQPLFLLLLSLSVLFACKGGRTQPAASESPSVAADTLAADDEADSTLYGRAGEFGMSTFTLISDAGDTLHVTRTASDGTDGEVAGRLCEGDRYALTLRDGGEAIGVLINLTQLERHVKDYEIRDGRLYIGGVPRRIDTLNDSVLTFKK